MTPEIGTPENPVRVAIVGAGPSGFYAAEHILKDEGTHAQVDLFDRLPTPFGLVRGGVAPDHPKIKSVIRVYEKTAAREGFRFFGNVKVGHDIEVEDLERLYHAIVFTVGCETDRQLGIPGEDLPGSHAATAFVGWYNAHPDYCDEDFDLSCERAVVIGNGNVAMDVARMLALTDDELRQTDTADHAIERLDAKKIREIVVLGRRGPAQAAFTNPEIKELGEMEDADVIVDPAEVELDPASQAYLESEEADKTTRVNVETLREFSQRTPEGKRQRIVLRFLASPVEIQGDGKVEKIVIGRNELVEEGGALRAKDTGEREELECGLVLRSVGYTGVPIEGVPFDEKRGPDPQRGRPRPRLARLGPQGRPLHGRLDQARPLGRDRHEQERRAGDRPAPARRRRRAEAARPRAPGAGGGRGAARRARRPLRQLRGLAGDRPGRGRPRRAARPPAGQVRPRRGDARRARRKSRLAASSSKSAVGMMVAFVGVIAAMLGLIASTSAESGPRIRAMAATWRS